MYVEVNVDAGAQRMTIVPRGELVWGNAERMAETIRRGRSDGCQEFTVDAMHLTYCDCAGLGALMVAYCDSRAAGHRFVIARPRPIVSRLIQAAGCQSLLDSAHAA